MKKVIALIMAVMMLSATIVGCGKKEEVAEAPAATEEATEVETTEPTEPEPVTITIADWPVEESNPELYATYQKYLEEYNKLYPHVTVETDTWGYDLQTYLVKAASGDLPTVFKTAPTELETLAKSGYIRDITKNMEEFGYLENYDERYATLYSRDGVVYALVDPTSIYEMGMVYNVAVFEEAGLVDENGLPIYPQTWEEVAETAAVIKEKTGKAGIAIAAADNHGGWHFCNIAWSYGANFVEQQDDGTWKAVFASPECAEALQYVKDLKWKYDVVQDNVLVGLSGTKEQLGTYNAGMIICQSSSAESLTKAFDIALDDVAMSRIPAGPEGRYALSSGNIYVFNGEASDAEVEAVLNWFDMLGYGPAVDEEKSAAWEATYEAKAAENRIVGIKPLMIWKDGERKDAQIEAMNKFANVDAAYYADYTSGEDVNYKPDPEQQAQALYGILDACLQEVLTNENADVNEVLAKAQDDFQHNFLDTMN